MGFEERNDNTRVSKPIIYEPIKRVPYLELVMRKNAGSLSQLLSELRSKLLMKEDHVQGKTREYVDKLKKLRKLTGQLLGVGAGLVGLGLIQGTPIGPYVNAALATHSGYNLSKQADKGTLGFNTETGLNTLGLLPFGSRALPYMREVGTRSKSIQNGLEYIKNVYNRYTAPKTNIKYTPYSGNQLMLSKYRLVNGGFDKLGINPKDVTYVPKGHPMYTPPSNIYQSYLESPVNTRQLLLKSEGIPLVTELKGIANFNPSTLTYTRPTIGAFGKLDLLTRLMSAHEFQHMVDYVRSMKNMSSGALIIKNLNLNNLLPKTAINLDKVSTIEKWVHPPGTDFTKIPSYASRYLRNNGGTELHARLAQLKNWYGITDPYQPITPEMWNYARRHYVNSLGGLDNNMQQMFRVVTDPKKFLDWINPRVATQTGVIGLGSYNILKDE